MTKGAMISGGGATGFYKAAEIVDGAAINFYKGAVIVGGQAVKIYQSYDCRGHNFTENMSEGFSGLMADGSCYGWWGIYLGHAKCFELDFDTPIAFVNGQISVTITNAINDFGDRSYIWYFFDDSLTYNLGSALLPTGEHTLNFISEYTGTLSKICLCISGSEDTEWQSIRWGAGALSVAGKQIKYIELY
jgi:hypothetical protein